MQKPSHNHKNEIFHSITCRNTCVINLLECALCELQFVGKCKTTFNTHLNKRRKDRKRTNKIPASKNFNCNGYSFQLHAKFILAEKLNELNVAKEKLQKWLKTREHFSIIKLTCSNWVDLTWTCHQILHVDHLLPHFVHHGNRQYLKGNNGIVELVKKWCRKNYKIFFIKIINKVNNKDTIAMQMTLLCCLDCKSQLTTNPSQCHCYSFWVGKCQMVCKLLLSKNSSHHITPQL